MVCCVPLKSCAYYFLTLHLVEPVIKATLPDSIAPLAAWCVVGRSVFQTHDSIFSIRELTRQPNLARKVPSRLRVMVNRSVLPYLSHSLPMALQLAASQAQARHLTVLRRCPGHSLPAIVGAEHKALANIQKRSKLSVRCPASKDAGIPDGLAEQLVSKVTKISLQQRLVHNKISHVV
jgi:hypothetical protein